jgi:hypothetical protein
LLPLDRPQPEAAHHPSQSVAACLSRAAKRILARMGSKSRETIYGGSVRAAAERATEARKEADRLAVEAWNKRMLGFQGPAQPRPRWAMRSMRDILGESNSLTVPSSLIALPDRTTTSLFRNVSNIDQRVMPPITVARRVKDSGSDT